MFNNLTWEGETVMNTRPKAIARQCKTRDQDLQEGIDRVYRKYGSDLNAFLRDMEREITKSDDAKPHKNSKRD
jgi:hypothetical protein